MNNLKRVVVTGTGAITSIGLNSKDFWRSCLSGESGISPIQKDGLQLLDPKYGGQIHNFNASEWIKVNDYKSIGRGSQLLIASMYDAIKNAELKPETYKMADLYVGTTMGEISIEKTDYNRHLEEASPQHLLDQGFLHTLLANACREFELQGETMLVANACSAGNYAIIQGYEKIRNGEQSICFTAGEDPFSTIAYYGFNRLKAIAAKECKPFDAHRDGMLVAEGAGCLVLEELEHAQQRGANILAEVKGYGVSCDAYHITAPHPNSTGIIQAMEKAIKKAGITTDDVDYISAHGTGTQANDKAESFAVNQLFNKKVPMSSIKSMIGHSMGAASLLEAIVCCNAVKEDVAPPTINFELKDINCDVDCIPNNKRSFPIEYAMNNSYAFGGANSSIIFKKFRDNC
ncbi:beta-ketoacyl-[acyl-carrier-protein] synthase family protein [Bacillus velezensis]|nr:MULTISPECIES: beta-ketoacyl-[acyl-carrier-protein] synthase family protein [Bacillus amyloliquefaciens group]MCM3372158.1 beta-ketoacyl-[acyl-carrier-protein] synthase family protein [Bacillus velezensis]MEC1338899.1 beta-ketoacyl-[acyl-carrier-protein] synthase family protein [Bacillus velezensis]